MTRKSEEQSLSVLLDQDDEPASIQAALAELDQDPELRARWGRYHLIRSALRGDSVRADYHRIAVRVGECLEHEPPGQTCSAEVFENKAEATKTRAVWGRGAIWKETFGRVFGSRPSLGFTRPASTWLPLTGAALAGVLALSLTSLLPERGDSSDQANVAAVTTPSFSRNSAALGPSLSAASDTKPNPGANPGANSGTHQAPIRQRSGSAVVNLTASAPVNADSLPWAASHPHLNAKLNQLVVGHQERASISSIKGFMPYATLVGYQVQP